MSSLPQAFRCFARSHTRSWTATRDGTQRPQGPQRKPFLFAGVARFAFLLLLRFARRFHVGLLIFWRFFRCVGTLGRVLLEPLDLGVHLEQLMPQLGPPVRLPWRDIEVGRDAICLERTVHFDRLRHWHARVLFADEENRRRLHVRDILQRRIVPIRLDRRILLPRGAAEPRCP